MAEFFIWILFFGLLGNAFNRISALEAEKEAREKTITGLRSEIESLSDEIGTLIKRHDDAVQQFRNELSTH